MVTLDSHRYLKDHVAAEPLCHRREGGDLIYEAFFLQVSGWLIPGHGNWPL